MSPSASRAVGGPGVPSEAYSHANPIKAAIAVPPGAWANIIFDVGLMEFATNRGKMTMMEMFEDPFAATASVEPVARAPARASKPFAHVAPPLRASKPFAPRRRKRVPGDLGWDPMGLYAEDKQEKYQMAELQHGALGYDRDRLVRAPGAASGSTSQLGGESWPPARARRRRRAA
ncbi:hypothetical protein SO694_00111040 [Aureococcus anophagefferens]|uniref:Uncharacterized protein n=1 Tax=Aureococcus anophagefferens TaxID=44056 RepID=A0ABR1FX37_AURAN